MIWLKLLRYIILIAVIFPHFVFAQVQKYQAPLFNNLSNFHYPVSTKIPMTQRFFDQGFVLYYGFEWGEAIRSFKEAARLDPTCGMCYWGLALAIGSKINAPVLGNEYGEAKAAIEKALALKKYETVKEQRYIEALAQRFKHQPKKSKPKTGVFSCHLSTTLFDVSSKKEISNYANAMKKVATDYPEDHDAKALAVYAAFDTIMWKFADVNGKLSPITPSLITALNSILAKDQNHIGANHYLIHVAESFKPESALESANRLRTLVPGSEHLVHMPTHIYFLTGRYSEATEANEKAIAAFKKYNEDCRQQGFEPEINYLYFHNYDFLRTTATMQGRKQLALSTAREMLEHPFSAWLANELSLQWFIPIPYYVEARFAMWADILKEQKPHAKYQYAVGMWHYARGMAFAHTRDYKNAEIEFAALKKIIQKGPNDSNLGKNGVLLLKIAHHVLAATLANTQKNEKSVIAHLKAALKIQHDMGYHEPPDWYFPVAEALANAYLHWNHFNEAVAMYKKDLQEYPKNGWALFGLAQSLRQLGNDQEANRIEKEFKEAWKYADIPAPKALISS